MPQGLNELRKPFGLIAAYLAWILVFRLLCLSFLVYFVTRTGHPATFEEINESFGNHEIPFIGLSAICFVLLLKGFFPLLDRSHSLSVSFQQLKKSYFPGFFQGALLAISIVAALWLTGSLRFVGFFVQIEDTPVAVLGIIMRIGALIVMGFCEEYLFRTLSSPLLSRILSFSVFYCIVKSVQFDLSWMHLVTLLLLSVMMAVRRLSEDSFLNGAGFWSAMLIVFHPVFSLPIFGSDFSGIFLLKYQSQTTIPASMSGGAGGPLSSLALQAILLVEIVRGWLAHKKCLLKAPQGL